MPSGEKNPLGPRRPIAGTSSELRKDHLSCVDPPGLSEGLRQALGVSLGDCVLASGSSTGESSDRWLCLKIKPEQGRQRKCERVHSPVDTIHVLLVPHNCGAGTSSPARNEEGSPVVLMKVRDGSC